MKQMKLYVALESLSKDEWKSLAKYVSMETSLSSDTFLLFQYMYDNKKDTEPALKSEVKQFLFPKMREKNFLNLCSRLFTIVEEWLVWYEIKKDKNLCGVHLVKIYNRKGVFELADKTFNRIHKKLTTQNELSLYKSDYLFNLYRYHYFSENPVKFKENKEFLDNLVMHYSQGYLEKSQLFIAELQNWGDIRNFDFTTSKTMLLNSIKELPQSESSEITRKIYTMITDSDQSALEHLYNLLLKGKIEKGSDLEVFVTLFIISKSIKLWTSGKLKKPDIISKIHDFGLSSKILMNLGKLSSHRFLNIISVLVLTSKPNVVYEFIEKWSQILEPNLKVATEAIAKCYVKREEENFNDIILLLRDARLPSFNLTMIGLAFQIKAFYKIKEYELAQNAIHNFKRRLRKSRTKSEKNYYAGRLNFLLVMEELIKKEHSDNTVDLTKYEHLHHKIWLSKQI